MDNNDNRSVALLHHLQLCITDLLLSILFNVHVHGNSPCCFVMYLGNHNQQQMARYKSCVHR